MAKNSTYSEGYDGGGGEDRREEVWPNLQELLISRMWAVREEHQTDFQRDDVTEQCHDFVWPNGGGDREANGILRIELLETHWGGEALWELEIGISSRAGYSPG